MSKEIKTETGEIALKEIEFKSSKYEKISFKDYETLLERYQIELLKLQKFVKEKGLKILILMEGRDAAGKGGTIKRLCEHLNPRGCRIVALEKPSNVEKTQWYFQRYVAHLPSGGEITIFDRSWYNRAMVEPVMGFCTHAEHKDFLRQVPKFEELLEFSALEFFSLFADFVLEPPEAWESSLLAELVFLEFLELFFSAEFEFCLLSSLELFDFVLSALFVFMRASSFS